MQGVIYIYVYVCLFGGIVHSGCFTSARMTVGSEMPYLRQPGGEMTRLIKPLKSLICV